MSISLPQIIIIALVVVLIFGTGKFPSMMENIAKGIKAFNKGLATEDSAKSKAKKKTPAKSKSKK